MGKNILTLFDSLSPEEIGISRKDYMRTKIRISQQDVGYNSNNMNTLRRSAGVKVFDSIKKKHYIELHDELQQYTQVSTSDVTKKEEIQEILNDILDKQSESTRRKLTEGLFNTREEAKKLLLEKEAVAVARRERIERERARRIVEERKVSRVDTVKASRIAKDFVKQDKIAKAIALANREDLFLQRNVLIGRQRDIRGIIYFYNLSNGRRVKNPFKE